MKNFRKSLINRRQYARNAQARSKDSLEQDQALFLKDQASIALIIKRLQQTPPPQNNLRQNQRQKRQHQKHKKQLQQTQKKIQTQQPRHQQTKNETCPGHHKQVMPTWIQRIKNIF